MILLDTHPELVAAIGTMGVLFIVQLLAADFIGIKAKHLPGSPVDADHRNLLFRASRVVANTNESLGLFLLACLFCVFSGASPTLSGYAAWGYVLTRALYAICYYANWKLARSTVFGFSLLALIVLLGAGAYPYF